MKKALLVTIGAVLCCVSLAAQAGPDSGDTPWVWQPGRAYMRPDGFGVYMMASTLDVGDGTLKAIGEVVQRPKDMRWPALGSIIVADMEGQLVNFRPANICTYRPQLFCINGPDGDAPLETQCWYEHPKYMQYEPCPEVKPWMPRPE